MTSRSKPSQQDDSEFWSFIHWIETDDTIEHKRRQGWEQPGSLDCLVDLKGQPLEFLPEELWEMIFNKLSNSELHSCLKVCVTFEQFLERRKSHFLFPQILPLLSQILPNDKRQLNSTLSQLCNSRLVCRSWKQSFDHFCQDFSLSIPHQYNFDKAVTILEFMSLMQSRPYPKENPFITKSLVFEEDWMDETNNFWGVSATLLQSFGTHVEKCRINVIKTESMAVPFLYREIIVRFTSLLPNLKALYIACDRDAVEDENEEDLIGENHMEMFEHFPIPQMTQITEFKLNYVPGALSAKILQALNPNVLRKLDICPYSQVTKRLTNLASLDTRIWSSDDLEQLREATWPLTELKLDVMALEVWLNDDSDDEDICVTISTLFAGLNTFGKTLTQLHLSLEADNFNEQVTISKFHRHRLQLPVLKHLRLETEDVKVKSLNFIEELEMLETLEIKMKRNKFPRKCRTKERIIFAGNVDKLLNSNVWEICKKLKHVSLKDSSGSYNYHWNGSPETSRAEVKENDSDSDSDESSVVSTQYESDEDEFWDSDDDDDFEDGEENLRWFLEEEDDSPEPNEMQDDNHPVEDNEEQVNIRDLISFSIDIGRGSQGDDDAENYLSIFDELLLV